MHARVHLHVNKHIGNASSTEQKRASQLQLPVCPETWWREEAGSGRTGKWCAADDESWVAGCSSPCLSDAFIASWCREIIAFSLRPPVSFALPHFLLPLSLCTPSLSFHFLFSCWYPTSCRRFLARRRGRRVFQVFSRAGVIAFLLGSYWKFAMS